MLADSWTLKSCLQFSSQISNGQFYFEGNGPRYLGSALTWVKAQVKAPSGLEDATRKVIDAKFKRAELDEATLIASLNLRRGHHLKLLDALIWASACIHGWHLVTCNTKDFSPEWAGIRLPYTL